MHCELCDSERMTRIEVEEVTEVEGAVKEHEFSGYIPMDIGIGEDDQINFEYCLDCGRIQGDFPLPTTEIEEENAEAPF